MTFNAFEQRACVTLQPAPKRVVSPFGLQNMRHLLEMGALMGAQARARSDLKLSQQARILAEGDTQSFAVHIDLTTAEPRVSLYGGRYQ